MKLALIIVGCLLLAGCPSPPPVKVPPPPPLKHKALLTWKQSTDQTVDTVYRLYKAPCKTIASKLLLYVDKLTTTYYVDSNVVNGDTDCYAVTLYDNVFQTESDFSNVVITQIP